jgi:putative spermidine/putrescine transport system ATP-binding protein
LLLDEPFSALDRKLRETMQVELKSLLRDRNMTAIFVTHDQEEAMGVSDRIAVMNAGQIEQFASPSELYARPKTAFVMDFVGLSTRLAGRVTQIHAGQMQIETAHGALTANGTLPVGTHVTIGVRPELIAPEPGENTLQVTLTDAMVLGSKTLLHGAATEPNKLICELPGMRGGMSRGDAVTFGWSIADTLVYEGAP